MAIFKTQDYGLKKTMNTKVLQALYIYDGRVYYLRLG